MGRLLSLLMALLYGLQMMTDSDTLMTAMTANARAAARRLAGADDATKAAALNAASVALRDAAADILDANSMDVDAAIAAGISPAMLDRLKLDDSRISAMASARMLEV